MIHRAFTLAICISQLSRDSFRNDENTQDKYTRRNLRIMNKMLKYS